MKAGATSALAVDIDAFAAHAAMLNAELNDVVVETSDADPVGKPTDADVILVGDLFYDRDLAPRVLEWLIAQQADGKRVLIGDPGRTYLPRDKLEQIAAYDIPVTRALGGRGSKARCGVETEMTPRPLEGRGWGWGADSKLRSRRRHASRDTFPIGEGSLEPYSIATRACRLHAAGPQTASQRRITSVPTAAERTCRSSSKTALTFGGSEIQTGCVGRATRHFCANSPFEHRRRAFEIVFPNGLAQAPRQHRADPRLFSGARRRALSGQFECDLADHRRHSGRSRC